MEKSQFNLTVKCSTRLLSWEHTPLYFSLRAYGLEALDLVLLNIRVNVTHLLPLVGILNRETSLKDLFYIKKNIHQSLLPGFTLAPKSCNTFSSTADAPLIPLNEKFT